ISLGLAPIVVRDIYARLPSILAEGLSLVIVEQDIVQALKAVQHVYCLQEGRVALAGTAASLTREAISAAYFGVGVMETWAHAALSTRHVDTMAVSSFPSTRAQRGGEGSGVGGRTCGTSVATLPAPPPIHPTAPKWSRGERARDRARFERTTERARCTKACLRRTRRHD